MVAPLALSLSETIRHDGHGGVVDVLGDPEALAVWLDTQPLPVPPAPDDHLLGEISRLRRAIRTLFADAVRPLPPSRADVGRAMPLDEAIAHLNRAAARAPTALQLSESGELTRLSPNDNATDRLLTELANSAIDLLTGPRRRRLRACQAPRCVRYFLQDRANQEWCKASCGNRARVARHHRKQSA